MDSVTWTCGSLPILQILIHPEGFSPRRFFTQMVLYSERGWALGQASQRTGHSNEPAVRHMVWLLGLSCAGPGVGLDDPCGSLSTEGIKLFYNS